MNRTTTIWGRPRVDTPDVVGGVTLTVPNERRLRVGVINLMPRLETYEPLLLASLGSVEPVWIRLQGHAYRSSDPVHLADQYKTFDRVCAEAPLDGLILTGAPIEELPFEAVHYWNELTEILQFSRTHIPSTLGICWGGLALAALEGISKIALPKKLFGAFEHTLTPNGTNLLPTLGNSMWCAQSRHAGLRDSDLEVAQQSGALVLHAHAPEAGYTLLATADGRRVMHLGHPEYEPSRIATEWNRDRARGRSDVSPPRNFNTEGTHPTVSWEPHSRAFFAAWLGSLNVSTPSEHP
jgi:homoserine O-succinyltransferase/O-acetyltransferase